MSPCPSSGYPCISAGFLHPQALLPSCTSCRQLPATVHRSTRCQSGRAVSETWDTPWVAWSSQKIWPPPALSYLPTPWSPYPTPTCLSGSPGSIYHPCVICLVSKATIFDEPIIIHIKFQLRLHHSLWEGQEMVTQPQLPLTLCSEASILLGCHTAPKGGEKKGMPHGLIFSQYLADWPHVP